jgi:uncharacterized protein (DUF427 family)
MRAIWNDTVIAESNDTVVVEGNHYFPLSSLVREHVVESAHRTTCAWKGEASYFTVRANGSDNANAAWYYPSPRAGAEAVADRVAFWKGVQVVP